MPEVIPRCIAVENRLAAGTHSNAINSLPHGRRKNASGADHTRWQQGREPTQPMHIADWTTFPACGPSFDQAECTRVNP